MADSKQLTKKEQEKVLRMFNGTKNVKAVRNGRAIAEYLGIPRAYVMRFLNDKGLTHYSRSSYSNC